MMMAAIKIMVTNKNISFKMAIREGDLGGVEGEGGGDGGMGSENKPGSYLTLSNMILAYLILL